MSLLLMQRGGVVSGGAALDAGSITATAGDEQVTISQNTAPNGGTSPYTRNLYRSTTNGVKGSEIAADVTLPYDDTGLTNDTTYYYTLEVDDSAAGTDDTPQVNATPSAVAWAVNRPGSYTTTVSDYDFSDAPVATDSETTLGGGWSQIYGSGLTQFTDAGAPVSPSTGIQWNFPSSGSGGTGVGNIFRPLFSATELYVCAAVWHDANFEWNDTSVKFLYWEGGNFLLQLKHFGDFISGYIGSTDTVLDCNTGPTPVQSDFDGKWAVIEWQVIRGASGTFRAWLNGTLVMEHTGVDLSGGSSNEVKIDSTWGGGGTHTRAKQRRIDHILVATP